MEAFSNFAYFTWEHQKAETLMQTMTRLAPSVIALGQLKSYGHQVLQALDCLHSANMVHGDLMPQTVWVDPNGGIKVDPPGIPIRAST